jgi:hypothetical protein
VHGASSRSNKPETRSSDATEVDPITTAADAEQDETTTELPAGREARGVLRLLEAGHFRGVADVRLRINFFDELSSKADAAALPVVEEQAREVVTAVEGAVDELVGTLAVDDETAEAVAEAVRAFAEAVQTIVDDTVSTGRVQADTLVGEIEFMFGELLERLEPLLVISTPESEPTPDTETEHDEDADPDTFSSLRGAFDDALTSLQSSITNAAGLPDPSPPTGHGRAYDKFLAIYNELRGSSPSVDATI